MLDQQVNSSPSSERYLSDFNLTSEHSDDGIEEIVLKPKAQTGTSTGDGSANNPFTFNEEVEPSVSPLVLEYSGYLKARLHLRRNDVQRLQGGEELCDRMIDFLLAHAHAVQYELRRSALSRVIVLPSAFGERLASLAMGHARFKGDTPVDFMMERLSMYALDEIWGATLLLVPVQVNHHWILIAVTNPLQAISRETFQRGVHDVIPGELKPDREPFTILLLNSAPQYALNVISKLPAQMRLFLELSWFKLKGSSLEFVNWYPVKCPEQFDSISCGLHVVHNAEVMMREGIAGRVRKASQKVIAMSPSEWCRIFNPTLMQSETYRTLKLAVVQQEAAARRRYLRSLQSPPVVHCSRPTPRPSRKAKPTRPLLQVTPGYTILVCDANILLGSLPMVSELVTSGRWTFVVPLAVVTELDALTYLITAVQAQSTSLKVQTSKGSYLKSLSIRSEATTLGEGERNMDDLIVRSALWQLDHFVDRTSLFIASRNAVKSAT
ncbi:hypothetical protein M407DRAFT_23837 [Tulasnella calospora MUT 4182]|uniref:Ubiquitin-like protease family profile domain-containing protein n=1 Tax=Tulasnella calospora MUT 4182 TaxID=1051891 RepID=A0A0C3Q9W3_9AGAM|nr:hypothetical protein M407DRAFT_23837 [Tulasnella calospora MUT 4182]